MLTSFVSPDKQAYPRHSLSRAALITSGSPIFFLDAFTILIVFYSSTTDPSLPFPPPQDCKLLFLASFHIWLENFYFLSDKFPSRRFVENNNKQAEARAMHLPETHVYPSRA